LVDPGRLIQAPLAQRAPTARSMMAIRYTPLNSTISQRTACDLSEEKIMQGLVTAGALVALADGEVKTVERAELVNFIDQQGFVSTISRVEIAQTFNNRVRELEDRYCANVLVENLRPLTGQSLGSVVVRIAQKVAAADREVHPGELRALKLLRQIMANLPAVRTIASSWSEKVNLPENVADRQCPICGQQVESTKIHSGNELPNELVRAFFPSLLLA
jgi:tellurite resistance protein